MHKHKILSLLDTNHLERMDDNLSEIFIKVTFSEASGELKLFDDNFATQLGFSGQVFKKRLDFYGNVNVTLGVALVVITLCQGSPGNLVMYAFTLARLAKQNNKDLITIDDIANAFPVGFPNERGLREIWDAQKGGNWNEKVDNLIDLIELIEI
jgi:hypothetical protein